MIQAYDHRNRGHDFLGALAWQMKLKIAEDSAERFVLCLGLCIEENSTGFELLRDVV